MPWYKLPHADLVMHFDREMDLEPADEPISTIDGAPINDDEPYSLTAPDEEAEAT